MGDVNADFGQRILGGRVFGPVDLHLFLVPTVDLHGAVEALEIQPAAGFHGVVKVEILGEPLGTGQGLVDIAASQGEQGNEGQKAASHAMDTYRPTASFRGRLSFFGPPVAFPL